MPEAPIAALFPGQGSQKAGMGHALYDADATFRETFDRIAEADGRDLRGLVFEGDEEELRATELTQSALYACGVSAFRAWAARGRRAGLFAGHSIGEYAALAAAGVVSDGDGARLVRKRGELMAGASDGAMAAVLGLNFGEVEEALAGVTGTVVIANDNCPGQLVISGEPSAVTEAGARLKEKGAKRVLPLKVSGAFHSPLMAPAARAMRPALDAVAFATGERVVANVLAAVPADETWPDLLERQLASPVRWTESVRELWTLGAREFVEFGSGEVLGGLVRRIESEAVVRAVATPEDLAG